MVDWLAAAFTNVPLERPVVSVAALFGAGVLTSLTPCIYPMIPITAAQVRPLARLAKKLAGA